MRPEESLNQETVALSEAATRSVIGRSVVRHDHWPVMAWYRRQARACFSKPVQRWVMISVIVIPTRRMFEARHSWMQSNHSRRM